FEEQRTLQRTPEHSHQMFDKGCKKGDNNLHLNRVLPAVLKGFGVCQRGVWMSQPIYDCIIVGSGAAGGMAAQKLCGAGLRTLMLEAGRSVDYLGRENYKHKMPWEFQHRGFLAPE